MTFISHIVISFHISTESIGTPYDQLDCPERHYANEGLLETLNFAVRGVVTTIVCILGILGNCFVSFVLYARKEMINTFNILLVALTCFDSVFLFATILENFRDHNIFNMATDMHLLLFPHLLYPLWSFTFTASIFMTVAIALERYVVERG